MKCFNTAIDQSITEISSAHRARVNLVGCCVQSSIGGCLKPRRILLYLFFWPEFRWPKRLDSVLPYRHRPAHHLSIIYPSVTAAFQLVVVSSHPAKAIEIRGPISNSIFILSSLHSPPKAMSKRPPPRVPPVCIASPTPIPPPTPLFGWLLR